MTAVVHVNQQEGTRSLTLHRMALRHCSTAIAAQPDTLTHPLLNMLLYTLPAQPHHIGIVQSDRAVTIFDSDSLVMARIYENRGGVTVCFLQDSLDDGRAFSTSPLSFGTVLIGQHSLIKRQILLSKYLTIWLIGKLSSYVTSSCWTSWGSCLHWLGVPPYLLTF